MHFFDKQKRPSNLMRKQKIKPWYYLAKKSIFYSKWRNISIRKTMLQCIKADA